MKKLLIALAIALAPMTTMALERIDKLDALSKRMVSEQKIVVTVWAAEKEASWDQYKKAITEYEKTNSDIVFLLAPMESEDIVKGAITLGISETPVAVFSLGGRIFFAVAGAPKDTAQMAALMDSVKAAVKRAMTPQKETAPPAPKGKEDGTMDYHPQKGSTTKVMVS